MKLIVNCPNCDHEAVYELQGSRARKPRGPKPGRRSEPEPTTTERAVAEVREWLAGGFPWDHHVTSAQLYALYREARPGSTLSQRSVGHACALLGVEHRRIMGERRYFPYYRAEH